ncbi:uncharacterized protein TM35_000741100 [Trypanosoma theileri]|uniref:Mucin-associated surface protein (MASP) n=1 Tax=Trypanosoma theileri TaxID=67003 RepID=A0A1X0NFX4_9TRYP|nr:uncharacterized protein TM35_000741100 [Trypanosoma theileri]ORC83363.1 hypothetical protein TM35_000741100 [Trypanosoma theileri]
MREMMHRVPCLLVLMLCCAYGCVSTTPAATQPVHQRSGQQFREQSDLYPGVRGMNSAGDSGIAGVATNPPKEKNKNTPNVSVSVPGLNEAATTTTGVPFPGCTLPESGNVVNGRITGKDGVTCVPAVPGSVPPLPSGPSPKPEDVERNLSRTDKKVPHSNGEPLQSEFHSPKGTGLKPDVPPNASKFPHGSKFPGVSGAVPIVHNKPDIPEYPGVPEAALHVGNGSSEAGRVRFSRPVTHATDAQSHSNTDSSDTASTQTEENNNQAETAAAPSTNEVSGTSAQSAPTRNTPNTPTKVTPPAIPTILQPPMPPKSETKPPKKRKADSSSISSVWVRVPLLIVAVLVSVTVY